MTFWVSDSHCEDLDPEHSTVVDTAKEPSSVENWEDRSNKDFEEKFKNVEHSDTFLNNDFCEDMKSGNMVTNEEAKNPTTIDKGMDEGDDELEEDSVISRPFESFPVLELHRFSTRMLELPRFSTGMLELPRFSTGMLEWPRRSTGILEWPRFSTGMLELHRFSTRMLELPRFSTGMVRKRNLTEIFEKEIMAELEKKIAKRRQNMRERRQIWEERRQIWEELEKKIEELEKKIAKREQNMRELKKKIAKLKKKIAKREQNMREIFLNDEDVINMKVEVIKMKQEVIEKKDDTVVKLEREVIALVENVLGIEHLQEDDFGKKERQSCFMAFLALLAYIFILCTILIKSALQKHLLMKYSFGKAALFLLWTSGDVEKHPGPPLNDMKTIREFVSRLVKEVQERKVVDWANVPPCWDKNVVPFQDINQMKNSDNEEKYAMFYEALCVFMKTFGPLPDWCVEEMTYVETGNAPELHKCQTARRIRELLEQHDSSDREDILKMAGYQRQIGSVPAQAVNKTNGHKQRLQKCPSNVPGFLPISAIKDPDTARKIAKGCIAQSKNAGKYQPGNQQKMTKKRSATKTAAHPAPKQPRILAANTNPRQATSTIVRPNTASAAISIVTSTQSTPTVISDSQSRATTDVTSSTSVATNTGASLQLTQNVDGQTSNNISTRTPTAAASNTKQPKHDGQPSNLISLPSDDLDDLGFSSNVDFDQFIHKIIKDDKM